ncbi:hypothetical protein [Streptomyces tubercidicus]
MPRVFPVCSSRRATLLWCRWRRSAAIPSAEVSQRQIAELGAVLRRALAD